MIRHEQNRGHIFTVNEGLKEARGRFVARIDPDDRYRSCFLSQTLPKFEAYPEVGFVYGDAAMINESGEITVQKCDKIHAGRDFKGNELVAILEKNFICAPTGIGRREAWLGAWPVPDGMAFNDWYFSVMLARRYEFYYVNKVLADYRVHSLNHHARIVRDRSEETSILRVLDRVFQEAEPDSTIECAKRSAKNRIYARQYLDFADKYFGCAMNTDARRCYLAASRLCPRYVLKAGFIRRLVATWVDRRLYNGAKRLVQFRRISDAS
jgi:glycosyltransferase involved in cell wall biosynthesis